MATLTIRLPDSKHEQLRKIAQHEHLSLNGLFESISDQMIMRYQLEEEFKLRAARGIAYRQEAIAMMQSLGNDITSS